MENVIPIATVRWKTEAHHFQLQRKFALMNSGIVPASAYSRDAEYLRALKVDSLRIDVGWGARWVGHTRPVVTPDGFDFGEVDDIARALNEVGVKPYLAYCYVPEEFRADPESWRSLAFPPDGWVAMIHSYVRGANSRGVSIGYHEVFNEPDLSDEITGEKIFFDGDKEAYLELYRRTSRAIKAADPTALVGGPSTGSVHANLDWIEDFLDTVEKEHLPIDFISFHQYGRFAAAAAWNPVLALLENRVYFSDVDLHLNEYNAFPIVYPPGGAQENLPMAAAMLAEFDRLLAIPRITLVHWAQFQDSGYGLYCGLLDIYGRTKPPYWAFRWYSDIADQPRLESGSDTDGLGSFVTRRAHEIEGIVWNRTGRTQQVELRSADGDATAPYELSYLPAETNMTPERRAPASVFTLRPNDVVRFRAR